MKKGTTRRGASAVIVGAALPAAIPALAWGKTAKPDEVPMSPSHAAAFQRFRVQELIGRYVDCLNHRDWERYQDCWVEDGDFKMTFAHLGAPTTTQPEAGKLKNLHVVGKPGIMKMISGYDRGSWLFQVPTGLFVQLNSPTTAQIRHTLNVISGGRMHIGICYDRARLDSDDVWRLTHRDYRPSYYENLQRSGQISRTMPDTGYQNLPKT